jgi:hypothetical protein
LLLPFALGLSACQTIADVLVVEFCVVGEGKRGAGRLDRTGSAPLLANTRGGRSTIIEGSGRFVGELPIGTIRFITRKRTARVRRSLRLFVAVEDLP